MGLSSLPHGSSITSVDAVGMPGTPKGRSSPPTQPVADKDRGMSSSAGNSERGTLYIFDASQLPPASQPPPDLRDLNNCLEALAVVFPDVQIGVFREMLCNFDQESRLAVVADALLKNRAGWVKGRWRATGDATAGPPLPAEEKAQKTKVVPPTETFRAPEYIIAVRNLAYQEFKGLSRSTINAVLAEHNYAYLDARRTLVELSQKSWRFAISSLLLYRRKAVTSTDAENHPLVIWKPTGHGSFAPSIKSTGNTELDLELLRNLILPLNIAAKDKREEEDRKLAAALNREATTGDNKMYECCCCFSDGPFEEFTACNTKEHMVCDRCVQRSINEAIFGQGWARSIHSQTGTLRCPAMPTDASTDQCDGCIPIDQMHKAMVGLHKGAEIMLKLEHRLADHCLTSSGLPVVRCPFCDYAEADDLYLAPHEQQLRFRLESIGYLIFLAIFLAGAPFLFATLVLSLPLLLLLPNSQNIPGNYRLEVEFRAALARHRQRRRGLRFTCQSPTCRRASCLSCSKAWVDIHVCHESSLVALRTQVEQAMSMAVKRVCPHCNASFVKTDGCNKMTCQCGYKMCYVCRKDIGGKEGEDAGYQHFCQHFRPQGDGRPCTTCNKCNLWQKEDTDAVLRRAREEVEHKWRETEQRELSGAEKAFLKTGIAVKSRHHGVEAAFVNGRMPTLAEFCDWIVSLLFT